MSIADADRLRSHDSLPPVKPETWQMRIYPAVPGILTYHSEQRYRDRWGTNLHTKRSLHIHPERYLVPGTWYDVYV